MSITLKVVNGKNDGFVGENKIYIGQANPDYNLKESPLHNPFKISPRCDRETVINPYKRHLWKSIQKMKTGDLPLDSIGKELIKLALLSNELARSNQELILACNSELHGEVVIAALNWLKTQDWFNNSIEAIEWLKAQDWFIEHLKYVPQIESRS